MIAPLAVGRALTMGDDDAFEAQMKGLVTDVKEYEKARCAPGDALIMSSSCAAGLRHLWRKPTI